MFRRVHLAELEDFSFIPSWFRDLMTDCLEAMSYRTRAYDDVVPLLERLINKTSQSELIDFGSGGGGPWLHTLLPKLLGVFPDLKLKLSDLYPNLDTTQNISKAGLTEHAEYLEHSIDMTEPPADFKNIRIMFTCFHHLKPNDAKKVLQKAVDSKVGVGIFEVTGRSLGHFLMVFTIPFLVMVFTPFMNGKMLQRILFTYLIPIVPLGCFWDGLASNFRTYSPLELKEMTTSLQNADNYNFEIGEFSALGPIKGNFLLGYPK